MVARLVFGQNQTVDIVTSGRRIRVLILVGTSNLELLLTRCTMVDVLPGKAVVVRYRSVRLVDNRLIYNDMYINQRVACQVRSIVTCLVIGNAVERDTTAFTNA